VFLRHSRRLADNIQVTWRTLRCSWSRSQVPIRFVNLVGYFGWTRIWRVLFAHTWCRASVSYLIWSAVGFWLRWTSLWSKCWSQQQTDGILAKFFIQHCRPFGERAHERTWKRTSCSTSLQIRFHQRTAGVCNLPLATLLLPDYIFLCADLLVSHDGQKLVTDILSNSSAILSFTKWMKRGTPSLTFLTFSPAWAKYYFILDRNFFFQLTLRFYSSMRGLRNGSCSYLVMSKTVSSWVIRRSNHALNRHLGVCLGPWSIRILLHIAWPESDLARASSMRWPAT